MADEQGPGAGFEGAVGQPPGGGGPGAPQPGGTYPPGPEPEKKRGKGPLIGAAAMAVVLALLVGAFLVLSGDDDDTSSASGEIFLEPAASVGVDPFSETPLADPPDPELATPATGSVPPPPSGSAQIGSQNGNEPGLYGGTMNMASCDPAKLVAFLEANPDKAAAFVAALDADPELRWSSAQLTVAEIPAYVATLTPIVLTVDTRVTNHGYANGKATARQSIIQKGSAVLVDKYGVPRVKCYCGNPLLPPKASGTPTFVGPSWSGFDYSNVSVVQQSSTEINVFVLKDITTGQPFERPAGTTGAADKKIDPSGSSTTATTGASTTTTAGGSTTSAPSTSVPPTSGPTTTGSTATTTPPTSSAPKPCPFEPPYDTVDFTIVNSRTDSVVVDTFDEDCNRTSTTTLAPGDTVNSSQIRGQKLTAFTSTGQTISSFQAAPGATWTIS